MSAEIESVTAFSMLNVEQDLNNKLAGYELRDPILNLKQSYNFIKLCLVPSKMDKADSRAYLKNEVANHFGFIGKEGKTGVSAMLAYYGDCIKENNTKGKVNSEEAEKEEIRDKDEKGIKEETYKEAEEEAEKIMQSGKALDKILSTAEKTHKGDKEFQELLAVAIASQSCVNTAGIFPSLHGPSGSGKSHAAKTHLHLVRAKWKLESTVSAKALYYSEVKAGTIIFSDDDEPGEALEQTIKRASTNFQEETKHQTVINGEPKILIIPPRILPMFTSVENNGSDQLSDRQVKCATTTTKDHRREAIKSQLAEANKGLYGLTDVDFDVLVCRYIYDQIKGNLFRVVVPFANKINFARDDNLRNTQRFLDMIKGYTVINNKQREQDSNGNLLATIADFKAANVLFSTQSENAVTKLTKSEDNIIKYIEVNGPCTAADISRGLKIPQSTVSIALKGRKGAVRGGLLEKCPGLTSSKESHVEGEESDRITTHGEYFSAIATERDSVFGVFEAFAKIED